MGTAASFLLDDAVYKNIRDGWNAKLQSSSQKLSGLVPFVEMYAVFGTDDVIFRNPMMFSQVAGRAIDITFQYTTGNTSDSTMEFQERFDIPVQAKIVPIASTAKAQTEHDTMQGSSFQGAAGVNDLAVTRGASGPMNVKYDLGMTMPNPEVINEMYEYSKLMILNSKFLLVYGWNPSGFEGPWIKTMPPRLVNVSGAAGIPVSPNVVELNHTNGGFYKSTLVTLNRFNFSLDNVGHMGGKLTFLTLAGNFLSATRADAVAVDIKKQLNGYSGMLFTAGSVNSGNLSAEGQDLQDETDRWIEITTDALEESEAYAFAWQADMERRRRAYDKTKTILQKTYTVDQGPPFIPNKNSSQWRGTDSDTFDGFKFDVRSEGSKRDNGHVFMINPSAGRYGVERRIDPFGRYGADGPFYPDEPEVYRYRRFTGAELNPGQNVPMEWNEGRDPMSFEDEDWGDLKNMNERGVGYYSGRGRSAGRPSFGDAVVPTRLANPQIITNARIAEWPDLAKDAAASRKIWESELGHEELAAAYLFGPKEVDVESAGGYPTGEREIRYFPKTGANHEGYNARFLEWFSERASDLYRSAGPMGTIGGMPPQYTREKLKTIPYLKWFLKKLKDTKTKKLGFMDIENGIPWATPDLIPDSAFAEYLQQNAYPEEDLYVEGDELPEGKNIGDVKGLTGKMVIPEKTTLDTMPAYGSDLMNDIWDDFMKPANPNRNRFFPVNPDASGQPVLRASLGQRNHSIIGSDGEVLLQQPQHFFDPETLKIMRNSCAISTMLLTVQPPQEPPPEDAVDAFIAFLSSGADAVLGDYWDTAEEQEAAELAAEEEAIEAARGDRPFEPGIGENVQDELRKLSLRQHTINPIEGSIISPGDVTMAATAKPVYYFLGAVLEALRKAMSNKVKFLYSDIPLEGSINPNGFPIPIPQVNIGEINKLKAKINQADTELDAWVKAYETIDNKHPGGDGGAVKSYNHPGSADWPFKDGPKTEARGNELISAGYRYPTEEEFDGGAGVWKEIDYNGIKESILVGKDAWGWAISSEEFDRQRRATINKNLGQKALNMQMQSDAETIMSPLMCKNVFELPVSIAQVRKILNEGNAPLHSLITQVLKACSVTTKAIKLSTRPYAADETYLEIFVANLRIDGAVSEVFQDIDVNGFLQSSSIRDEVGNLGNLTAEQKQLALSAADSGTDLTALAAARSAAVGAYLSNKAVLCEFGSQRSLVESFNLSSKVDPLAFASFRLPDVVGGQMIDISKVVRGDIESESMGLMNDIRGILEDGMYSGHKQLKDLQIIGERGVGGQTFVNTERLRSFLLSDTPAASKIQTTFLTNLMATDQSFNTKILALQNEAITGSGDPNNPENNSFYGGVLSSYLRSISLTIHGVVGLSMFNVVYIKGLMRGIEGLYLITSINESLTPGIFSTSLECKLIQYKNQGPSNQMATNNNVTLQAAADQAAGKDFTDFDALYEQTERYMESQKNQGLLG